MLNAFSRTQLLLGSEAMDRLAQSHVAVFGIGGVGGLALEGLARPGIGALDLIDDDKVCLTNINRQLLATRKTVGKYKVDVAAERIAEINPKCEVKTYKTFYLPETAGQFDFSHYSYVVDAINTVSGKIQLALAAQQAHVPIISSMSAGNKLDPTAFRVADIYKTRVDPLARVMRRELKRRGVYTAQPPVCQVPPSGKGFLRLERSYEILQLNLTGLYLFRRPLCVRQACSAPRRGCSEMKNRYSPSR